MISYFICSHVAVLELWGLNGSGLWLFNCKISIVGIKMTVQYNASSYITAVNIYCHRFLI